MGYPSETNVKKGHRMGSFRDIRKLVVARGSGEETNK
jgi:hypothetical protein